MWNHARRLAAHHRPLTLYDTIPGNLPQYGVMVSENADGLAIAWYF